MQKTHRVCNISLNSIILSNLHINLVHEVDYTYLYDYYIPKVSQFIYY